MKKLVFDYEMRLSFSAPVTDHRFQLRCIPSTGPRQQVIDVEVKIQPETELETTIDSFDSVVMTGFIPEPHDIFSYSVTGIAFVDNAHIHKEAYKPLYRFNSALTIPGPNVEAMIAVCRERLAALPSDATPVQQAAEVMDEVYKAFVYTPGSTTIRTTAEDGRWVGLDPTHNRLVDDSYITIAHGRDYRDCMLDIGIFSGYNVQQSQWVNASVHEQVA